MTREEIKDFCDMKAQLEPENEDIYKAIVKALEQELTTKNDIRDNRVKNELNRVKDELEPTTKNCESCRYYGLHHEVCNYCYKCSLWTEQEPTTKNDLAVEKTDMIDKSNFSQEQYKTDLQSAYDSGYEQAENDLEVDWESYKDVDGNSLDDLILDVIQRNFDCGNTYGYKVADEIIGLLPSVTPQEPFINKPCVSSEVCEHDKQKVLDKIRAEIEEQVLESLSDGGDDWFTAEKVNECLDIIDKYKAESEVEDVKA